MKKDTSQMLNKGQEDEECDATDDDSSNAAGPIILIINSIN
jgi:hypothetical protein